MTTSRLRWLPLLLATVLFAILLSLPPKDISAGSNECQKIQAELDALKAGQNALSEDAKDAPPSQKPALNKQINDLTAKINQKQRELKTCSPDMLNSCSPGPNSYYRLPFDNDPGWKLGRGNWDDPVGHGSDPNGGQAFSYDFVYDSNNDRVGEAGKNVRAARAGTVTFAVGSLTQNVWNLKPADPGWGNGKAYFFKDDKFLRFDVPVHEAISGGPITIAGNWKGIPASFQTGIDAAILWDGKVYMFKDSEYIIYNATYSDADGKVDGGYPKPIAGNWPGWPASWASGIDAAVIWKRYNNNSALFFKGSEFIRYDMATKKIDAKFPRPIVGSLLGLPPSWASGIDAAVDWSKDYILLFKGSEYVLYGGYIPKVSEGYPKPIAGNWPGWPASWNTGITAAVNYGAPRGEGNLIVIKHADGTAAAYAHLEKLFVKKGDLVKRGQVIALSGNTGNSSTPHLHFDVHPTATDWNAWTKTIMIRFQDQNHTCWRPKVGAVLKSNNSW